jgi:hypothetical protein
MNEHRRSQRIDYLGTGWLQHKETQHFCRVENISEHGAMVTVKNAPIGQIHQGEKCCLRLYQDAGGQHYRNFAALIVRFESAVAGLEFIELEGASKEVLENIIKKEQHLFDGAHKMINLAREVAKLRGIELTEVHFDKGELIPEREIHTLRLFTGEHTSNVHFQRADIEEFYIRNGTVPARMEIHKAIDRLLE